MEQPSPPPTESAALPEQRGLVISTSGRIALVQDIYRGKLEESLDSISERYYKQQFRRMV